MSTSTPSQPLPPLSFTKLVVHDLERMAAYYCDVYGLHVTNRHKAEKGALGEPIDEIMLSTQASEAYGSFILFKFVNRPAPRDNETILGFTTDDLDALVARVLRAGGSLAAPIADRPELGIRLAMARDPEGHINELVEPKPRG